MLVVALFLPWWGTPPALIDPPAGTPAEITFPAEAFADDGTGFEEDGFRFFGLNDITWLLAGVAGFGFGLTLLVAGRSWPVLSLLVAALALLATALIASVLVSPPDFLAVGAAEVGRGRPDVDVDVPFGRLIGGFVALGASTCLLAAAAFVGLRR